MADQAVKSGKRRRVSWIHKHLANPIMRRFGRVVPGHALLETTGRKTGLARVTPVGGRLVGSTFWLVAEHGRASNYVLNIAADAHVRLKVRGRWRQGVAHLLDDDDARKRLRQLPRLNSAFVRMLGTDLLTVRVDLD